VHGLCPSLRIKNARVELLIRRNAPRLLLHRDQHASNRNHLPEIGGIEPERILRVCSMEMRGGRASISSFAGKVTGGQLLGTATPAQETDYLFGTFASTDRQALLL
jgi:hypothetical protein